MFTVEQHTIYGTWLKTKPSYETEVEARKEQTRLYHCDVLRVRIIHDGMILPN